jgi:Putative prokaryotic signal transducing protein
MIYRDPKCVYVADSPAIAEVIVLFLGENNIAAQVMNPETLGGFLGLTPVSSTGVSSTGIEVWVHEPQNAERARELIAQREVLLKEKAAKAASRTGTVNATCDECGKVSEFPAAQAGTVQDCPECGEYMDVPDLEPDRENEPRESDQIKKTDSDME